jgi:hypothetical protein
LDGFLQLLPQLLKGFAKDLHTTTAARFALLFNAVSISQQETQEWRADEVRCSWSYTKYFVDRVRHVHTPQESDNDMCVAESSATAGVAAATTKHVQAFHCSCCAMAVSLCGGAAQLFPTQHVWLRARCRSIKVQLLGYALNEVPQHIRVGGAGT